MFILTQFAHNFSQNTAKKLKQNKNAKMSEIWWYGFDFEVTVDWNIEIAGAWGKSRTLTVFFLFLRF
jgi:hypothetical protein